jgi:hypothetical protein
MAQEIDEVSQKLGELSGQVAALIRQSENNERNAKGRWANVYARFDEQDRVLVETAAANKETADEVRYLKDLIVDDVKPVTDDVKRWRLMGMGVHPDAAEPAQAAGLTVAPCPNPPSARYGSGQRRCFSLPC